MKHVMALPLFIAASLVSASAYAGPYVEATKAIQTCEKIKVPLLRAALEVANHPDYKIYNYEKKDSVQHMAFLRKEVAKTPWGEVKKLEELHDAIATALRVDATGQQRLDAINQAFEKKITKLFGREIVPIAHRTLLELKVGPSFEELTQITYAVCMDYLTLGK